MEDKEDYIIYKPCKKCGAMDYDNVDIDEKNVEQAPDGRYIMEPLKCDKCTFELMLSESNELH